MPENDIKPLLKDLNKVLKDQTKKNLTQQQRLDLSNKDLDLSDQIISLLKEQNKSIDDLKEENPELENIQVIYRNLRQEMSDINPAVPIDNTGVAKGMMNRDDESVIGKTISESIEKQEEFKSEINDLTNVIKSLNTEIKESDDENQIDNLKDMLDNKITELLQLFVSNQQLTDDYLKDQNKTLEDFFQKDLDNLDYLKNILEKHEEELEKWNDEWNESIGYFKSSTKDLFDNVIGSFKGHFNDIFGELHSTFIEPLMGIGASLFEFGKATFGLAKKPPEEEMVDHLGAIKTTLSNMYESDKERDKRDARNFRKDDKDGGLAIFGNIFQTIATVVGGALFGLGTVIGSITGRFLSFFTLLGNITKFMGNFLKLTEPVNKLISLFTTSITKIEWIDNFMKILADMGERVKGLITKGWRFVNNIPVLGKLFQGIARGISKFALPLTMFLGAIDFIKGFMEDEGNIVDKIQSGLTSAIEGFIDLPVKLLGWIGDKILSLFGAEIEGGLGNLMKSTITNIVMFIPNMFADFFNNFISSEEAGFFDRFKNGLRGSIGSLIEWPINLIGWAGDWLLGLFDVEIKDGLSSKLKNSILDFSGEVFDILTWIPRKFVELLTNLFSWDKIYDSIMSKVKNIPGAKWIFGDEEEAIEEEVEKKDGIFNKLSKGISSFFTRQEPLERGIKDDSEKGGPISSMPSVGVSGNMMILNDIKYILLEKLNKIIKLLSGTKDTSSNIISGIGKTIGNLFNKFKGEEDKNVKDVVGVGTELSEVPGSITKDWVDPMGTGKRITSEYGARIHPVTGKMQGHKGLDMAGPEPGMYDYPIKASKDGIVSIAKSLKGYGNVIYMDHEDGYQTRYAHLNSFKVKPGEMVAAGDVIGGMGNTGVGTGPHLHYEIRKDGKPLNPMNILSAKDGAMISSNNMENEFAAKVHPDEAILPLNDDVLTKLGEKISQFVDLPSSSVSNIDKYIKDLINIIKVNNKTQESNNIKFLNSLKEIMSDKENRETIMNNINNRGGFKEDIPDKIENSMLMLLNSSWGV